MTLIESCLQVLEDPLKNTYQSLPTSTQKWEFYKSNMSAFDIYTSLVGNYDNWYILYYISFYSMPLGFTKMYRVSGTMSFFKQT